jgi:NTE family protein
LKKLGLALGSGSARGWAHIGVIQCLQEAGIEIDLVCGTSIGALVGGALAGGYMEGLENMVRKFTWSDIVNLMDFLFPRSGFIEGDKITNHFRKNFSDARIEELAMPFGAVATDIVTGREIWLQEGSLMDAVRASISIPGIFTPYKYKDLWLVDGALVNPVPVSLCRAMGADIVVAVNVNSELIGLPRYINRENQFSKNSVICSNAETGRFTNFLNKHVMPMWMRAEEKILEDEHSIFDVVNASINIMQDRMTRQRLAGDPPDLLISPRLSQIGTLEFNRAAETIEEGRRAAFFMMPMLKTMIKE